MHLKFIYIKTRMKIKRKNKVRNIQVSVSDVLRIEMGEKPKAKISQADRKYIKIK